MEKTALESSIVQDTQRAILEIRQREASEIEMLERQCTQEIEAFREKTASQNRKRIAHELSKIRNRVVIEGNKIRLCIIEEYIDRVVEEAAKEMKNNSRYLEFLARAVCAALKEIEDDAVVGLKKDDLVFKDSIAAALRASAGLHSVSIREDSTIKMGGCIVYDDALGRIFNMTVERIIYRRALLIRQEVMRILAEKGFVD